MDIFSCCGGRYDLPEGPLQFGPPVREHSHGPDAQSGECGETKMKGWRQGVLMDAFMRIDKDHDGSIDMEEFVKAVVEFDMGLGATMLLPTSLEPTRLD